MNSSWSLLTPVLRFKYLPNFRRTVLINCKLWRKIHVMPLKCIIKHFGSTNFHKTLSYHHTIKFSIEVSNYNSSAFVNVHRANVIEMGISYLSNVGSKDVNKCGIIVLLITSIDDEKRRCLSWWKITKRRIFISVDCNGKR